MKNAFNLLYKTAERTFVPGNEMSFYEGGIASKSNYNPVRQYKNSKLEKYRIDFFILANVSSGHNFIIPLMSIREKNKQNIGIAKDLWNLPTTQKAFVNAILSTGF